MATSIQITFDAADCARQARFWAEALGYMLQPPPPGFDSWEDCLRGGGVPEERLKDWAAIVDPDGTGPRVYFQRVPEGKTAKNRVHLDLNVSGGPGPTLGERMRLVDAEVARLRALGATDRRGPMEIEGEYWVRMNDPEDNEFCVQ